MRMLLSVLLVVILTSCGKEDNRHPEGLELLDGNVLRQADWQGKWVYINYWAEWCKPCAEEVPELNAFAKAHPGVLVLGVNFDKPPNSQLLNQALSLHIDYPVVTGDIQPFFPHEIPAGLPTTLVISPAGQIVETLQGPQTSASLSRVMTR